jgi:WD40 repeat protein
LAARQLFALDKVGGHVGAVAFSPDGTLLAVGNSAGEVRLYDAANGALLATLTGHTDSVTGAAFAPDGRALLTSSIDGTVRVWAVAP